MKKNILLILIISLIISTMSGCIFNKEDLDVEVNNQLIAGYLYTPDYWADTRDERMYSRKRKQAISTLMKSVQSTSKYSINLISGLEKYEENLLEYLDKIDNPDEESQLIAENIINKMIAYETAIQTRGTEIEAYMDMKAENDAVSIILDNYMLSAVVDLVNLENEYISYLIANTTVVSTLLKDTSERHAEKLISTSESIYKGKIESNLKKMVFEYVKASEIHAYICSSDYYASQLYIGQIAENITKLKSNKFQKSLSEEEKSSFNEEIKELEYLYNQIKNTNNKPSSLKPVPKEVSINNVFIKIVYAEGEESNIAKGISLLGVTKDINSTKYEKDDNYGVPDFNDTVNQTNKILQSNPSNMKKLSESKSSNHVPTPKDAEDLKKTAQEAAQKREEIIKKIEKLQGVIKDLKDGGIYAIPTILYIKETYGTTEPYALIVKILTEQLEKHNPSKIDGSALTKEQYNNFFTIINNELETLLGDKKDEFVKNFANIKANDLINKFDEWKKNSKNFSFIDIDKDALATLLSDVLGIQVDSLDDIKPSNSPTPKPNVTLTPTPTPTPTPTVIPNDDTQTQIEDIEVFEATQIIASYDLLKRIDPYESNEKLMMMIYGWEDSLDYSQYKRNERKNSDGEIYFFEYVNSDNRPIGWWYQNMDYTYHYPNEKEKSIKIIRRGTNESNYVRDIVTMNEKIGRQTFISFTRPKDESEKSIFDSAYEKQDGKYDGLVIGKRTNYDKPDDVTVSQYSMGNQLELLIYREDVLIEETTNNYNGDNIITKTKIYFDNGNIKKLSQKLNGKDDGVQIQYYENGNTSTKIAYQDGKKHGKHEIYYENGQLKNLTTYENGKKNGKVTEYYENTQEKYVGTYKENKRDGIWYSFLADGAPNTEIGYKDGIQDGVYHKYAIDGPTQSDKIHVIGQYADGKETGIWIAGYNNEGFTEKHSYKDGIKEWTESSGYRKTYDKNGIEIKSEKID